MYVNKLPRLRSFLAPFSSQQGFGQLAVIALLVAGVAITTLVVQNRTNHRLNLSHLDH
jgi:anti-sigma-K factor RskA